jgi:phosphoribosyl-AMP cyclohydrolase
MQAGEVSSGQGTTNRANTIKVSREKGFVVYMADSETEMVEWMSALEGTVSRLMRIIADCDADVVQSHAPSHMSNSGTNHSSMLAQAENSFKQRAQQHSWSEPQQQRPSYGVQGVPADIWIDAPFSVVVSPMCRTPCCRRIAATRSNPPAPNEQEDPTGSYITNRL